jgi:hypothetical protein
VAGGRLPAVRLANKVRLDLRDLDAVIESAKRAGEALGRPIATKRRRFNGVPRELAPRRRRRRRAQ